jgi:hypothetical protein
MPPAKKKKLYIGIVIVGLGAIVVDRLIGYGAPNLAVAGQPGAGPAGRRPVVAPTPTPATGAASNLDTTPFPNLTVAATTAADRDPFAAPPELFETPHTPEPDVGKPGEPPPGRAATFADDHTLSAVVDIGGARYAILDGKLVTAGQIFDGCALQEISPRSVRLRCLDGDTRLHLAAPLPDSAGR